MKTDLVADDVDEDAARQFPHGGDRAIGEGVLTANDRGHYVELAWREDPIPNSLPNGGGLEARN